MTRLTILVGLLLTVAGCASVTPPPLTIMTDSLEASPFFWVADWGMYLREGDVVEYAGRYHSVRSGRWAIADSPDGPWSFGGVTTRRRADAPPPARPSKSALAHGRHPIVTAAMHHVGTPYVWGGARPPGFDCSGFVQYVYGQVGVPLPRTVRAQYRMGTSVPRDELAVGDVVFFDGLRHNGIYIGDGRFVHASKSGDVVKISALDDGWFRQRWVGARRLPQGRAAYTVSAGSTPAR